MDEMRRVYDLSRVTIEGYRHPQALVQYKHAGSCRRDFAEPLAAGGQSLLDTWVKVNEASRRVNADPERLKREFEIQLSSARPNAFRAGRGDDLRLVELRERPYRPP